MLASVFLRGAGLAKSAVLLDLAVVLVSCIGILAVGIVLYSKYLKSNFPFFFPVFYLVGAIMFNCMFFELRLKS
jgi:hypothetical protein